MPKYRFTCTERHLADAIRRHRVGGSWRHPRLMVTGGGLVALVALIAVAARGSASVIGIAAAGGLFFLLIGPAINHWMIIKRFRRSPFYRTECLSS